MKTKINIERHQNGGISGMTISGIVGLKHYLGKVRDVFEVPYGNLLAMFVSDRLSTFDVVLPRPIPYKGQVLNEIALHFLRATEHIVPNWIQDIPQKKYGPNGMIGRKCKPFKIEMIIRGYLTGHAWRTYRDGKRMLCGVPLPEGMKEHDKFPEPIITPSTKAEEGHDEDISREEILAQGLVTEKEYRVLEEYTRALFQYGTEMSAERELILVDTKYEFGKDSDGKIRLIDEVHTPDSSRYFYSNGYQDRQDKGEKQRQLSKEFAREWLIERGYMGKEGQVMPELTDEFISNVSDRYIELLEKLIGKKFVKKEMTKSHTQRGIDCLTENNAA